jgi:hypothetical protein
VSRPGAVSSQGVGHACCRSLLASHWHVCRPESPGHLLPVKGLQSYLPAGRLWQVPGPGWSHPRRGQVNVGSRLAL